MAKEKDRKSAKDRVKQASLDVRFPSDQVTIGTLRRLTGGDLQAVEALIYNLMSLERELIEGRSGKADIATARVRMVLDQERAKELADLYVQVGIAQGKREGVQLVDSFMAAVSDAVGRGR